MKKKSLESLETESLNLLNSRKALSALKGGDNDRSCGSTSDGRFDILIELLDEVG